MQISRSIEALPERYRHVFAAAVVRDAPSMAELLELVRDEAATHPESAVFLTLDDLDQTLYTSGHATESDELEVDTSDLDFLGDPDADRVLQLRQFAHTRAQLARPEHRVEWASLAGSRPSTPDGIDVLATINDDPTPLLDDVVLVLHTPLDEPTDAVAALPNGYFAGDWNVFHNHAVARHLARDYGYRPLGIGASWVGFVRDAPLSAVDAAGLVAELTELYGSPDAPGWARLTQVLARSATLFLGYTDNFAE